MYKTGMFTIFKTHPYKQIIHADVVSVISIKQSKSVVYFFAFI